jgi:DNA-binding response OmpR family regulator
MDKKERRRILAIDNEPDLTMLCRMALEHYGFEVDTFNDPQEALSNMSLVRMIWLCLI